MRVRATNGLARYSFHNQLLIALQRPDATYVAGFRAFLALNRCVRRGEKAIRILAPMSVKTAPTPQSSGAASEDHRLAPHGLPCGPRVRRRPDRPPARPEPVPLDSPAEPIQGDSHARPAATLVDIRR